MRLEAEKKRIADKLDEKMVFVDTLLAQITVWRRIIAKKGGGEQWLTK